MSDGRVLDRAIERVRLRFYVNEHTAETPIDKRNGHTGYIRVSTREATVVDLVREPLASGSLNNVATILTEIGELDGSALATLAARHGRTARPPHRMDGRPLRLLPRPWPAAPRRQIGPRRARSPQRLGTTTRTRRS